MTILSDYQRLAEKAQKYQNKIYDCDDYTYAEKFAKLNRRIEQALR